VSGGERRTPAANNRVGVGQGCRHVAVVGGAEAFEGAEGGGAHAGVGRAQAGTGAVDVALMSGHGDAAPRRLDRDLSP
jgi:hypothetical protein